MKVTNPETGQVHVIDQAACDELTQALENRQDDADEIVFRAMRLNVSDARMIVDTFEK